MVLVGEEDSSLDHKPLNELPHKSYFERAKKRRQNGERTKEEAELSYCV